MNIGYVYLIKYWLHLSNSSPEEGIMKVTITKDYLNWFYISKKLTNAKKLKRNTRYNITLTNIYLKYSIQFRDIPKGSKADNNNGISI